MRVRLRRTEDGCGGLQQQQRVVGCEFFLDVGPVTATSSSAAAAGGAVLPRPRTDARRTALSCRRDTDETVSPAAATTSATTTATLSPPSSAAAAAASASRHDGRLRQLVDNGPARTRACA